MSSINTIGVISSYALLVLTGCTVSYDQATDQQITSTIQNGDQQLSTWQSMLAANQKIGYEATAYGKILGGLQALKTRLKNSPDFETKNLTSIVDSQITLWTNIQTIQLKSDSTTVII